MYFQKKSNPDKNILQKIIRNSNTPKIIPQNINSNPSKNQPKIGNSNTEQSNIFIVLGSSPKVRGKDKLAFEYLAHVQCYVRKMTGLAVYG